MEFRPYGTRLMLLNLLRRNLFHKQTADFGCELHRGQLPVLEAVIRHPNMTQADAAMLLRVTPASIALSTKRLQKSGLIEKQADPENHRRNLLRATSAGETAAMDARVCFDQVDEMTFRGLSDEELHLFYSLVNKMIEHLNPAGEAFPGFPVEKEETDSCLKN